jgi:alkaline phosphatase
MRIWILAALAAGLAALPAAEGPPAPRSVVLVVGDGTGWQQWGLLVAARRAAGEGGKTAFHRLADQGVVGSATTFAAGAITTDSAAGATALASAVKTRNGAVGVDADGNPVPTCLEAAAKRGLWTGVVTNTAVTDATPGAFTAHVKDRRMLAQVAEQQIRDRDLRVILGGGTMHFLPKTKTCAAAGETGRGIADAPSRRGDEADLVAEAKAKGFAVATNRRALLEGPAPDRLLGLFAPFTMPYAIDRDEPEEAEAPTLAEMTARALEVLGKSEKGFFLLVEGGRVDHACHANDAGAALGELRDLDAAIEVLLRERERRKDLLVVVTADHETGGLGVSTGDPEMLATQKRSLEAVAGSVGGARPTLEAARAAVPWLPDGAVALTDPKVDGRGPFLGRHRAPFGDAASAGAGISFSTDGHTATPVPVVAAGPAAERFAGLKDNTEIGQALMDILSGK